MHVIHPGVHLGTSSVIRIVVAAKLGVMHDRFAFGVPNVTANCKPFE